MGQVLQFKRPVVTNQVSNQKPAANPLLQIGKDLQGVLQQHGVDYSNEQIRNDHLTIMYLVQAMLDRSLGKDSPNVLMIECIRQSLGYMEDPVDDNTFEDLLDKLP